MRYRVLFHTFAGAVVEVDADTAKEAIEAAEMALEVSLCHHCAGRVELGDFQPLSEPLFSDGPESAVYLAETNEPVPIELER